MSKWELKIQKKYVWNCRRCFLLSIFHNFLAEHNYKIYKRRAYTPLVHSSHHRFVIWKCQITKSLLKSLTKYFSDHWTIQVRLNKFNLWWAKLFVSTTICFDYYFISVWNFIYLSTYISINNTATVHISFKHISSSPVLYSVPWISVSHLLASHELLPLF